MKSQSLFFIIIVLLSIQGQSRKFYKHAEEKQEQVEDENHSCVEEQLTKSINYKQKATKNIEEKQKQFKILTVNQTELEMIAQEQNECPQSVDRRQIYCEHTDLEKQDNQRHDHDEHSEKGSGFLSGFLDQKIITTLK